LKIAKLPSCGGNSKSEFPNEIIMLSAQQSLATRIAFLFVASTLLLRVQYHVEVVALRSPDEREMYLYKGALSCYFVSVVNEKED